MFIIAPCSCFTSTLALMVLVPCEVAHLEADMYWTAAYEWSGNSGAKSYSQLCNGSAIFVFYSLCFRWPCSNMSAAFSLGVHEIKIFDSLQSTLTLCSYRHSQSSKLLQCLDLHILNNFFLDFTKRYMQHNILDDYCNSCYTLVLEIDLWVQLQPHISMFGPLNPSLQNKSQESTPKWRVFFILFSPPLSQIPTSTSNPRNTLCILCSGTPSSCLSW